LLLPKNPGTGQVLNGTIIFRLDHSLYFPDPRVSPCLSGTLMWLCINVIHPCLMPHYTHSLPSHWHCSALDSLRGVHSCTLPLTEISTFGASWENTNSKAKYRASKCKLNRLKYYLAPIKSGGELRWMGGAILQVRGSFVFHSDSVKKPFWKAWSGVTSYARVKFEGACIQTSLGNSRGRHHAEDQCVISPCVWPAKEQMVSFFGWVPNEAVGIY
jgi:hypothetical protein